MAAVLVSTVSCLSELMNVSRSSTACRRLITAVLNGDRTRQKRCAGIRFCQARAAAHFTQDDELTHIPTDKVKISYSRSSGAGGQHVNKVSTKAEVRFHVQTADWLPEAVKTEILLKNKTRINKAGELIVTSDVSRSQRRNLEDCLLKISAMIKEAQWRPEEPSEEDETLREHRLAQRNLQRLKQKKIQAATKQARRVDFD